MSDDALAAYLKRPMARPQPGVLEAIGRGPIERAEALDRGDLDRLLDPAPLAAETGWCTLDDGIAYVAVRTPMPLVSGPMVDWWFDWHARDALRYRAWHPVAHITNSVEPATTAGSKAHWGAVHHPVEDVGTGVVRARIGFVAPTAIGLSTDALDDPRVATIVCGHVGDDRLRVRHSLMIHVFLREGEGIVLRSRFWLGAALRPYLPPPLAGPLGWVMNRRFVRRRALPAALPRALALHCAEEFANLAEILPELFRGFGPAGTARSA